MDKNILNAVAEVLKDERAKFDRQISELRERADDAVGNDADIAELKSSIEFLFEEVDKKTEQKASTSSCTLLVLVSQQPS